MSKDSESRAEYTAYTPSERREIIAQMCFEAGGKIKYSVVMERFECCEKTAYEDLRSDEVKAAVAELIRREFGVDGALQCYKVLKDALTSDSESTRVKVAMYLFEKMISFSDEETKEDWQEKLNEIHNGNGNGGDGSKEKNTDAEQEGTH